VAVALEVNKEVGDEEMDGEMDLADKDQDQKLMVYRSLKDVC
jgi:hypothetical protein